MGKLYNTIQNYKNGNINEIISVLEQFDPLLNKFNRNSYYEDMKSELSLYMFHILNKIPLEKKCFNQDKFIISYIYKSLKNKYIHLNKTIQSIHNVELENENKLLNSSYTEKELEFIEILDMFKNLTDYERNVLIQIYIYNFKESEIARNLKVSRQAINKTHKKALSKLKNLIK